MLFGDIIFDVNVKRCWLAFFGFARPSSCVQWLAIGCNERIVCSLMFVSVI